MLLQIWRDESASVLSAEIILLATVLVVGLIVGAKSFRDSAVTEWADYAQAIANLDQSYNVTDYGETFYGSHFIDQQDFCDSDPTYPGPYTSYGGKWADNFLPYTGNDVNNIWGQLTFGMPAQFEQ